MSISYFDVYPQACRRCGEAHPGPLHQLGHRLRNLTVQPFCDWLVGAP